MNKKGKVALLSWVVISVSTVWPKSGEARPALEDTLTKGSKWSLTVNHQTAALLILGGKGSRKPDGGWQQTFDLKWGEQDGVLKANSDGSNAVQRVKLQLKYKNGMSVVCSGVIAQGTDNMMAGTCGRRQSPGAWYAVRSDGSASQGGESKDVEVRYRACQRNLARSSEERKAAQRARNDMQAKLRSTSKDYQSCKRARKQCQKKLSEHSSGPSVQPYAKFRNQLTGRYDLPFDQVGWRGFPDRPPKANSDVEMWLNIHRSALGNIVQGLFGSKDYQQFRNKERKGCQGNIYCEIGYRQQAISYMLGGP